MKRRQEEAGSSPILKLDDFIFRRIFSFLNPLPDRFNVARVCKRWQGLVVESSNWLRVVGEKGACSPGTFCTIGEAVQASRPGDTILIEQEGGPYIVDSVVIDKPLFLLGSGLSQDDTVLSSPRGSEGAFILESNARLMNFSIHAEFGNCLLHRCGKLTVENCALVCEDDRLSFLHFPLVSTAPLYGRPKDPSSIVLDLSNITSEGILKNQENGERLNKVREQNKNDSETEDSNAAKSPVTFGTVKIEEGEKEAVSEPPGQLKKVQMPQKNAVCVTATRFEGGDKAMEIKGKLSLKMVRVAYSRSGLFYWFSLVPDPQKGTQ